MFAPTSKTTAPGLRDRSARSGYRSRNSIGCLPSRIRRSFRKRSVVMTTLRLRNDLRIRLGRHPIELRERYPDLADLSLRPGAVVFDVGANIGNFSESVLAHQPWARIHAFEPQAGPRATLQEALAPFGKGIVINATA